MSLGVQMRVPKFLLLIFVSFLMGPNAYAQQAFYASGLLGASYRFDDALSDIGFSYGARVGVLFNENISVGLYWQRFDTDIGKFAHGATLVGDPNYTLEDIMVEVTYYAHEADENTFWVSGLLGIKRSMSSYGSDSRLSYGFSLGYQFLLAPNFTLSPQLTMTYADFDLELVLQTSALANLTFWF